MSLLIRRAFVFFICLFFTSLYSVESSAYIHISEGSCEDASTSESEVEWLTKLSGSEGDVEAADSTQPEYNGPSLVDYMNSGIPKVHNTVSILSGAWVDSTCHAADSSAIEPYQIAHVYSSNSLDEGSLADGWEFFHPTEVEIISCNASDETVYLFARESGGATISFEKERKNKGSFKAKLERAGYTFTSSIASPDRTSPFNTSIDWDRHKKKVYMTLGDGRKRVYEQCEKKRLREYSDKYVKYHKTTYHLIEEISPTGIVKTYKYDKKTDDLLSITTRLANGEKVGYVTFESIEKKKVVATLSSGRKVIFYLKKIKDDESRRVVTSIKPEGRKKIHYHYCERSKRHTRRVEKKDLSDGNTLIAKFYTDGKTEVDGIPYKPASSKERHFVRSRVRELYTKNLPGENSPTLSHAFIYKRLSGYFAQATVREMDGYETKYVWHKKSKRIRWVYKTDPKGRRLSSERLIWGYKGKEVGRLLSRVLFDEKNIPILIKEWEYNNAGLVIKETLRGKFTHHEVSDLVIDKDTYEWRKGGEALVWKAKYDEKGRKTSETDPMGYETRYSYSAKRGDLIKKCFVLSPSGKVLKRSFFKYDADAPLCIEEISDDGCDEDRKSLKRVSSRIIKRYKFRRALPQWGAITQEITSVWTPLYGEKLFEKKEYIRDEKGRITEERLFGSDGVLAKSSSFTYDQYDRVLTKRSPDGTVEINTYDEETGRLIRVSSPQGVSAYTYDHSDRVIREDVSYPDGSSLTKHTSYDLYGRKSTIMDERGRAFETQKDSMGRPVCEILPTINIDGVLARPKTSYKYAGMQVIKTLPQGAKESLLLSALNKPFQTISALNEKVAYRYDKLGREIYRVNNEGLAVITDYDERGRVTAIREVIDGNNQKTVLEKKYSGSHLVEEITPGLIKRYTYDHLDRKSREELLDRVTGLSSFISYVYDAIGRTIETIDETKGIVCATSYDSMDRVIASSTVSLSDPTIIRSSKRMVYDSLGNLTEERLLLNSTGEEAVTTYSYGKYNMLSSITNPEGQTTFIETSLQEVGENGLPYLVETKIHPDGTSSKVWKNSLDVVVLSQVFDPLRRLISERHVQVNVLGKPLKIVDRPFDPITGQEKGISAVTTFEYDSIGNCVAIHKGSEFETLRTIRYRYDLCSRLTHEVKPSGVELYSTYDKKGRLTSYSSSDGSICYKYEYNDLDLPTVIFDCLNNQTVQRRYNGFGLMLEEVLPDGIDIQHGVSSVGERTSLSSSYFSPINYAYSAGALETVRYKDRIFHYSARTPQSLPLTLESDISRATWTYDTLSRRRSFSVAATNAVIPSYQEDRIEFDSMGRLLRRDIKLPGSSDPQIDRYRFDYLGQISSENDEIYQFDSLQRATSYRGKEYSYNVLNELDGDESISFDVDGRRITDKNGRYLTYDALDRLTSVTIGSISISYFYDAFHRRTKRILKDLSSGQIIQTERFLFCGDDEIGSLEGDEKRLSTFRVLGEGLGAEIGAALLIENKGVLYLPVHDLSGHVRLLIDTQTMAVAQTLDYSAFGPEDHPEETLTPWTFSSKRVDSLTGYIFFGRRYYDPSTLTWLTLDPLGFDEGPNLYAYVRNSPLSSIDLYGLYDEFEERYNYHSFMADQFSTSNTGSSSRSKPEFGSYSSHGRDFSLKPTFSFGTGSWTPHSNYHSSYQYPSSNYGSTLSSRSSNLPRVWNLSGGEACCQVLKPVLNSSLLSLVGGGVRSSSQLAHVGNGSKADFGITFINGILNSFSCAMSSAQHISNLAGGFRVNFVHNATHTPLVDLFECALGRCHIATEPVKLLHQMWNDFFSKASSDAYLLHICHSQGAIHTCNALLDYPPELRQRILVVAVAPAAYIYSDTCAKVIHYRSTRDFVPLLDPFGAIREKATVRVLDRHPQAPHFDHDFTSKTYKASLKSHIENYLNAGML